MSCKKLPYVLTQLETHEVIMGNGKCVNAGNAIPYEPGTISIMQAGVPHEVNAGSEGLYLNGYILTGISRQSSGKPCQNGSGRKIPFPCRKRRLALQRSNGQSIQHLKAWN